MYVKLVWTANSLGDTFRIMEDQTLLFTGFFCFWDVFARLTLCIQNLAIWTGDFILFTGLRFLVKYKAFVTQRRRIFAEFSLRVIVLPFRAQTSTKLRIPIEARALTAALTFRLANFTR